jgi:hypothetical protein
VRVFCDGKTVADHERVWAWHQTITDPEHREAANMLHHNRIGALRPVREHDEQVMVEQRCLSDYDAALGIEHRQGQTAAWRAAKPLIIGGLLGMRGG